MILTGDTFGMIMDVALAPGAAPAVKIFVRPELYSVILSEGIWTDRGIFQRCTDAGLTMVVDRTLPGFPGFEVRRRYAAG